MVAGSIEEVFNLLRTKLPTIKFNPTEDSTMTKYADSFSISDEVFYGKDLNNNMIYRIKNGLFTKNNGEISILYEPDLAKEEEKKESKIISFRDRHKKVSFDINEFVELKNKALNGELTTIEEIQIFYYEVQYLIDSMHNRKKDDELNIALDDYMEQLNQIYENHPDVLTTDDLKNIEAYNNKKNKIVDISRKSRITDISRDNKITDISNKIINSRNNTFNNKITSIGKNNSSKTG